MTKHSWHILVAATLLIVAGAITLMLLWPKEQRWTVRIATATRGGTYHPLGVQLAHELRQLPGGPIKHTLVWETSGSAQNITLLCNPRKERKSESEPYRPAESGDSADIAFVVTTALAKATPAQRDKIRALAPLYRDVVQVVVKPDSEIVELADLWNAKTVYMGKPGSGARQIAEAILNAIKPSDDVSWPEMPNVSYEDASKSLVEGAIDAAFFCSGTPTDAVKRAFESGGRLLNLRITPDKIAETTPVFKDLFEKEMIPANFYENQPKAVDTLSVQVILVCRKDLHKQLASLILDTLFDNVNNLIMEKHAKAEDIRLQDALDLKWLPPDVELHPGAEDFRKREKEKLLIATGTLAGKYHDLGRVIETLLEENGIPARAIHTEGSIENAILLRDRDGPTVAIMQYDTARAAHLGSSELVYRTDEEEKIQIKDAEGNLIRVERMRRIAALHEEMVHILMRRDKIPESLRDGQEVTVKVDDLDWEGLRVSFGPRQSGSRFLGDAILIHHDIPLDSIQRVYLSVPEMMRQLDVGEIDVGFFTSWVPSQALKAVLASSKIRLLSINPTKMRRMLGPGLILDEIKADTYGCQKSHEDPIDTISTRAILVTTTKKRDRKIDVGKITQVLIERFDYLGLEDLQPEDMAMGLRSIRLHGDAKNQYEKAGYLALPLKIEWVNVLKSTWYILAILVVLVAAYKGLLKLRRDRTSNEVGRRAFAVDVEASEPYSVTKLIELRREMRQRVKKRWWQPGEIDKSRWRTLEQLVNEGIKEAKENLARAIVTEVRTIAEETHPTDDKKHERYAGLRERIWKHLENGELDAAQHAHLMKVIEESGREETGKSQSDRERKKMGPSLSKKKG